MTDWRAEIIRERAKRKRRQKEQVESMTANPQTPASCSEPARTEPAGEAGAPTETATEQAVAASALDAMVDAVCNLSGTTSCSGSYWIRSALADALAPYIVISFYRLRADLYNLSYTTTFGGVTYRRVLDPEAIDAIIAALHQREGGE